MCSMLLSFLRSYVNTCLRAFVLTCLRAYVLTCLRAYVLTCLRAYVLTCLRAYVVAFVSDAVRVPRAVGPIKATRSAGGRKRPSLTAPPSRGDVIASGRRAGGDGSTPPGDRTKGSVKGLE